MTYSARLHQQYYAADLKQWIPYYNHDVLLRLTKHGNLRIVNQKSAGGRETTPQRFIFNRAFQLVSHTPSKRQIAVGAVFPSLSNIVRL